jgi:hypothetical protein
MRIEGSKKKVDKLLKYMVEFKASLIAAKQVAKQQMFCEVR